MSSVRPDADSVRPLQVFRSRFRSIGVPRPMQGTNDPSEAENDNARAETAPTKHLGSFLSHVQEVAAARRETLRALARALDESDHEAALRHAKALVGR